jgi:hypothetical protein
VIGSETPETAYDGSMRGHALVAGLVGALLLAQAGATPRMGSSSPSGRALDQLTNSVMRPVPTLPPPTGQLPSDVWVPDRIVPVPDQPGGLIVPGHWERRLSDHQNYVPPLTTTTPDGRILTVPGGVMAPPVERQSP